LDRLGEARSVAVRSRRIALESVVVGMAMSLVAMGFAAIGLLPAVWGALLQEGIDVIVILNALRALRPARAEMGFDEDESALARRFQSEHLAIRADLDRLLAAANAMGTMQPAEVMTHAREVHQFLIEEVAPHEQAEQELLYPVLEHVLGGREPTAPMSRAHIEILHQIRRLGALVDEIGDEEPDVEDIDEIRRLLYGLHAILRLHTLQEEESYLSFADSLDATLKSDSPSVDLAHGSSAEPLGVVNRDPNVWSNNP